MNVGIMSRDVEAFRYALGAPPEVSAPVDARRGVGLFGWTTSSREHLELPATEDLVVALHLGGAEQIRAVTEQGLSRSCSVPGLVTVLPPGRATTYRMAGRLRVMTLHVPGLAGPGAPAPLAKTSLPLFAFQDDYVRSAMEALLRAVRCRRPDHPDYIPKLADALLCHLSHCTTLRRPAPAARVAASGGRLGDRRLGDVLDYIRTHLCDKLSLEQLASRAGLSRASFASEFKAVMGLSAHRYITQCRIEQAKKLLHESDYDLAHIAQEVGFCSQSHFTETFHALTAVTPGRFRGGH